MVYQPCLGGDRPKPHANSTTLQPPHPQQTHCFIPTQRWVPPPHPKHGPTLQESHRAGLHSSSSCSRERAGIPVQEDPLPPETSLRGSAPTAASWPAGEAVCAGSPGRGDAAAFRLSLQQLPIAGMAPGAVLMQHSEATRAVTMLERAAWPFSISQGGAPAPALSFFPPYPPFSQPERQKGWRWRQRERAASPSSRGK